MKYKYLFLIALVAILILDTSAEIQKIKKRKKIRKNPPVQEIKEAGRDTTAEAATAVTSNAERHEELVALEKKGEENFQDAERERASKIAQQAIYGFGLDNEEGEENEILVDPCSQIHCSAGRVCELDKEGEPQCVCISECPFEKDERRRVCTNHNETFGSDCEVHRQRCLCMSNSVDCKGPQYHHVQIEYYGICKNMVECATEEMADFPRRMRDWLFYIMRDLAERHELSDHYMQLEKEADQNLRRGWVNAAIWKWCDLDADDNDRFVSRHELFPIRAPLLALEHCIAPFLNGCDYDNDHRITLKEWGKCLELNEDEFTDKCEEFTEN